MNHHSPRTSELLIGLLAANPAFTGDGRLSVGELVGTLRNRAFGLSLLLFALPNCLPIPGLPFLFGTVLLIISAQMLWGRDGLWLPDRVNNLKISRLSLEKIIHKALPTICWIERFCRPRFAVMASPYVRRIVGVAVFLLSILLVITPIPWLGSMPQGFAIAIFGLGLTERDGVVVTIGFVLSAIAFSVSGGIGYMLWLGADRLI